MTKAPITPTGNESLSQIEKTLADIAQQCNDAIAEGNLPADMLAIFPVWEKAYAEKQTNLGFKALAKEDNPRIAAIKRYSFSVMRHKETRDTNTKRITKVEIVPKDKQIALDKFYKAAGFDTMWVHNVSAFNQLMCLWAAQELGYSKAELEKLAKSYYLGKQVRAIASGGTPTSNNALCKALQKVIDGILPPESENGVNTYKCNNHDIAYLKLCYVKKGRETLGLAISKDGYLRTLITDVLHRIVENKRYNVEYKAIEEKVDKPAPKSQVTTSAKSKSKPKKAARKSTAKKVVPATSTIPDLDTEWLDNAVDLDIAA